MHKHLQQELINVSKAEIPEVIYPYDHPNRQAYVDDMASKVMTGELTYYDIGRDLQLTTSQIKYCEYFAIGETMGNGTKSALLAYGLDPLHKMQRQDAANYACRFNKPTHPCHTLVKIMINGAGMNANNLDQNLLFVCEQNYDLKAKTLAIREANSIMGRNNKKIIEVNVSHKIDYSSLPKKDLQKLVEIARKAQIKDDESK